MQVCSFRWCTEQVYVSACIYIYDLPPPLERRLEFVALPIFEQRKVEHIPKNAFPITDELDKLVGLLLNILCCSLLDESIAKDFQEDACAFRGGV